ncbi:MAG: hypothetical protein J7J86_04540 [Bacteroidales bacterium]|nr:hypothetical protein [Bacteroidales bacterium]
MSKANIIINRGINSCNLFKETINYKHFLRLYDKYINPIADTFAWVLMPNHFHFLVRIKDDVVYKYSKAERTADSDILNEIKWDTINLNLSGATHADRFKIPIPHLHFSHLFNSYTKYFNNLYNRHGSLFERPFKRKLIEKEIYLKYLVLYIHNNAVHHGFCDHAVEYPWSSYLSCISFKTTKLQRDTVIEWFDDRENFKFMHNKKVEVEKIEKWLEI